MKFLPRTNVGFTLIELMVVIAILGVISAMMLANASSSLARSRDARRKSDLAQLTRALELYYNDKNHYPYDDSNGRMNGCGADAEQLCNWGDAFSDSTTATVYMAKLPQDPLASQHYYYVSDGTKYQLYTFIERTQDPDVLDSGGNMKQLGPSPGACFSNGSDPRYCNYGVASSNITP